LIAPTHRVQLPLQSRQEAGRTTP